MTGLFNIVWGDQPYLGGTLTASVELFSDLPYRDQYSICVDELGLCSAPSMNREYEIPGFNAFVERDDTSYWVRTDYVSGYAGYIEVSGLTPVSAPSTAMAFVLGLVAMAKFVRR